MKFIVIGWSGRGAMELSPEGYLWHGDDGTLFPDYESARNALRRTKRYSARHNLKWDLWKCAIQRVSAPKGAV